MWRPMASFADEHIIFDNVTPEWIAFCQQTLKSEVLAFARVKPAEGAATQEN